MGTVDWSSHSALVRNAGPIDEAVRLLEQAVALIKPLCDPSAPAPTWRLTDREAAVLSLLREGRSNREISRALGISVHTARTHVSRVLAKFYVRSRWQLLHRPNDLTAGLKRAARQGQILAIARARGLAVVEDAAQSIGAEYKGRRAGSIGVVNCFSFYPGKNLGAYGDGGMLTT